MGERAQAHGRSLPPHLPRCAAELKSAENYRRKRRPDSAYQRLCRVETTILGGDLDSGQTDDLCVPRSFGDDANETDVATPWLLEARGLLPQPRGK
jgi:hypothetical protein